jgi:hypothetical protein
MTFWQQYAYLGTLCGIGLFLWYMMNLPITKTKIKKWIVKVKTEIFPEQKRQRKEIYDKITKKLYPEYYEMKIKGEMP